MSGSQSLSFFPSLSASLYLCISVHASLVIIASLNLLFTGIRLQYSFDRQSSLKISAFHAVTHPISDPILSVLIPSDFILSDPIRSYFKLSDLILFNLILSDPNHSTATRTAVAGTGKTMTVNAIAKELGKKVDGYKGTETF